MIKGSIPNLVTTNTCIRRQSRGVLCTPIPENCERANVNNGRSSTASIRRWYGGKIGVIFNWGVTRGEENCTIVRRVSLAAASWNRWERQSAGVGDRYFFPFFFPLTWREGWSGAEGLSFRVMRKTDVTPTKRRRCRYLGGVHVFFCANHRPRRRGGACRSCSIVATAALLPHCPLISSKSTRRHYVTVRMHG